MASGGEATLSVRKEPTIMHCPKCNTIVLVAAPRGDLEATCPKRTCRITLRTEFVPKLVPAKEEHDPTSAAGNPLPHGT